MTEDAMAGDERPEKNPTMPDTNNLILAA